MFYRFGGVSTNEAAIIIYGPYLEEFVFGLKFVLNSKPEDKTGFWYRCLVRDEGAPWNFRNLIRAFLIDFI